MISNPATFFAGGGSAFDEESFVYEGGRELYHFCSYDCGISRCFDFNVIFFADNKDHARDVLRRMLEFGIYCKNKQLRHYNDSTYYSKENNALFKAREENEKSKFSKILENFDKVKLELAPKNQFYKVGWASNDTL